MNTDVIEIRGDLSGSEAALQTAERFLSYNNIKGRDAVHIRLLTEEALSLVNGVMDDLNAKLCIESEKTDSGLLCRIRLTADQGADERQESRIKSVSTSGKNESARGVLGKLRELVRRSSQRSGYADEVQGGSWIGMGMHRDEISYVSDYYDGYWSLDSYRKQIESKPRESEEWDELEKSIIANLADDVKVYFKSGSTEILIEKLLK